VTDPDQLAYAAAYAARLFPSEVRLVHFTDEDTDPWPTFESWAKLGDVLEVRRRSGSIADDFLAYVREARSERGPNELINVIIPETIREIGTKHLLQARRLQLVKAQLLSEGGVIRSQGLRGTRSFRGRWRCSPRNRRVAARRGPSRVGRAQRDAGRAAIRAVAPCG